MRVQSNREWEKKQHQQHQKHDNDEATRVEKIQFKMLFISYQLQMVIATYTHQHDISSKLFSRIIYFYVFFIFVWRWWAQRFRYAMELFFGRLANGLVFVSAHFYFIKIY